MGLVRSLPIACVAAILVLLIATVPTVGAQGMGRGGPPLRFEWTAPDTATKNHTVALDADGAGEATFRLGYRMGGGGGGGPTGGVPPRVCQPGTKLVVPITIVGTSEILPHMVSVTPDKASFDIGQGAPSAPGGGGSTTRWSENHKVSVHYETANLTAPLLGVVNLTTGPVSVTGGQCTSAPTVSTPGKDWMNFTYEPTVKPAAAMEASAKGAFAPGLDLVSLALVGLVGLGLRLRRAKD